MAFNPYFPAYGYQYPAYQPQQQSGGLVWVQGIEGAKSHPVGAGQSILLMDSESNCFFIKSADSSGMPLPLRVFDYTERIARGDAPERPPDARSDSAAFVTRAEFEARIEALCAKYGEVMGEKKNAE